MSTTVEHRSLVLEKAQNLVNLLNKSEEMKRFRQAENKINRHANAQALLFNVKMKRNAYSQTSLRHGYDHPAAVKAKSEYDTLLQEIAAIPLIEEFQESQEELNDVVQGILKTIVVSVSDLLPVEKSEDPGDAGSHGCGSCSGGGCGRHH